MTVRVNTQFLAAVVPQDARSLIPTFTATLATRNRISSNILAAMEGHTPPIHQGQGSVCLRSFSICFEAVNKNVELSKARREMLNVLTRRVRFFTVAQAGRTWWAHTSDPRRQAAKHLRALEQAGLVRRISVASSPEEKLAAPILIWDPRENEPMPDFGALAWRLKNRWKRPVRTTLGVIAADAATIRFGGPLSGRPPRESEATHDVHLAQIYLRFLVASRGRKSREQKLANRVSKRWRHEDELSKVRGWGRFAKLPDAIVEHRRDPTLDLVIEVGGTSYSKRKLTEFHDEFGHLQYQIW